MKKLLNAFAASITYPSRERKFREDAYMLWRNEYRTESFEFVYSKLCKGEA